MYADDDVRLREHWVSFYEISKYVSYVLDPTILWSKILRLHWNGMGTVESGEKKLIPAFFNFFLIIGLMCGHDLFAGL